MRDSELDVTGGKKMGLVMFMDGQKMGVRVVLKKKTKLWRQINI